MPARARLHKPMRRAAEQRGRVPRKKPTPPAVPSAYEGEMWLEKADGDGGSYVVVGRPNQQGEVPVEAPPVQTVFKNRSTQTP